MNRRILAAMLTVGALSLATKVLIAAKDLIIGPHFGLGDVLDAFYVASMVPTFAVTVIAGSFTSAFIPTYIQVRERSGGEAAQRLLSNVMAASIVLLVGVSAVLAAAYPFMLPILASRFSPQKIALTRTIFYAVLPMVTLTGIGILWAAVLNSRERFALAAATPIITPVLVLVLVAVGVRSLGIWALVGGLVCGSALEVLALGAALRATGTTLAPKWTGFDAPTRRVVRQYAPMAAGAVLMGSSPVVDQAMAALLGKGSVAALNYGNKIVMVAVGVAGLAVGTAVMPYYSRMVALQDWSGVRRTLRVYLGLIAAVTLPLTAVTILASVPVIRLLFERGAFTPSDTLVVARVQSFYALQIPFYVSGILVVRLISALCANDVLLWGSAISMVVNAALDYVLMQYLGVAGIALSTSCVYLCSLVLLLVMLARRLPAAQAVPPAQMDASAVVDCALSSGDRPL